MPKEERQALIIAMSLHEKGKAALKKGNLQLAIVLLLEAKDEYNQCRSEILTAVDNYGLLNLDISWCYLRLGNLTELPNAQERLKECENSFKKSYGENLERVMALKGNSSNEAVLYVCTQHMFSRILKFLSVIIILIEITVILAFYNLFQLLNANPFRTNQISWKKSGFGALNDRLPSA